MLGSRIEFSELLELAARGACLEDGVDPANLPRLAAVSMTRNELAASGRPQLAAEIRFENGPEGLPRVNLKISGNIDLECQRCLLPFGWPARIESRLTILRDEEEATQLVDPFDSILMSVDGLDLREIVEDEILAALPLAPVHDIGSECAEQGPIVDKPGTSGVETSRPFENLASLMGRTGKNRSD